MFSVIIFQILILVVPLEVKQIPLKLQILLVQRYISDSGITSVMESLCLDIALISLCVIP